MPTCSQRATFLTTNQVYSTNCATKAHPHTPEPPTCGGSRLSSWMDSIWPSFSAAPLSRHSAAASRSALSSDRKEEYRLSLLSLETLHTNSHIWLVSRWLGGHMAWCHTSHGLVVKDGAGGDRW